MLLLDEMLPMSIAMELTQAGHDSDAVSTRLDLRGSPDADVLEAAAREGRILVTDNICDFVPLSNLWAGQGRTHPGIILFSSMAFPMARGRSWLITAALLARCVSGTWPQAGQCDFLRRDYVSSARRRR
jgi:hypothetical protein